MSSLTFNRMRDEVALGLVAAAFTVYILILMPNYQHIAYENTEEKEYVWNERFVGYPASQDYPQINSIDDLQERWEDTFTIEVDVTELKALDLYMNIEDLSYSTNVLSRTISNKCTSTIGRFFLVPLVSGEEVIVLLDELTIGLPENGKVILPIGEVFKLKESEFSAKMEEVSGVEDVSFFIDMASEWKDGADAKKVENIRTLVAVFSFIVLWIVYSKSLIKLCEKK